MCNSSFNNSFRRNMTSSHLDSYVKNTEAKNKRLDVTAYLATLDHLSVEHPDLARSIIQELRDQRTSLKLIASENYSSLTTQLAMANLLTDKYSEGYSGHRFYPGCANVDHIEDSAVEELKQLYGVDHAYVQPHSGADANLVAFWAVLVQKVQDKEIERLGKKTVNELSVSDYESIRQKMLNQKILGLALDCGGHLTHGFRHNISSKMMRSVCYGVDKATEQLDYKEIRAIALKEKPRILIAGYSAYPRLINCAVLKDIAHECGATFIVDMAHFSGLVAGKAIQGEYDPAPYADIITSTTHKSLRGPRGGLVLCTNEFRDIINKGCPLVLGGALPHVIAAKKVAFAEANTSGFKNYAQQIIANARAMADQLLQRGIKLFTGGTDNHLIVIDVLTSFGLTGRQAETVLLQAGMTANRNMIPDDQHGAWYTSGLRLGTPALTTRGLKELEMRAIADLIVDLLKGTKARPDRRNQGLSRAQVTIDGKIMESVKNSVQEILQGFPLYPELPIL